VWAQTGRSLRSAPMIAKRDKADLDHWNFNDC